MNREEAVRMFPNDFKNGSFSAGVDEKELAKNNKAYNDFVAGKTRADRNYKV